MPLNFINGPVLRCAQLTLWSGFQWVSSWCSPNTKQLWWETVIIVCKSGANNNMLWVSFFFRKTASVLQHHIFLKTICYNSFRNQSWHVVGDIMDLFFVHPVPHRPWIKHIYCFFLVLACINNLFAKDRGSCLLYSLNY